MGTYPATSVSAGEGPERENLVAASSAETMGASDHQHQWPKLEHSGDMTDMALTQPIMSNVSCGEAEWCAAAGTAPWMPSFEVSVSAIRYEAPEPVSVRVQETNDNETT